MAYKNEQAVQKAMIDIIRKRGGYVYKNAQSMYTQVGIPDLTACIPIMIGDRRLGLFLTIEVKLNEKKYDASEAQKIVGRQIQNCGGIWLKTSDPMFVEETIIKLQEDNYVI